MTRELAVMLLAGGFALAAAAAPAGAQTTVDAQTNIFKAGTNAGAGDGHAPTAIDVTGGSYVTFTGVGGQTRCFGGSALVGPDGLANCAGSGTNINSSGGISGLTSSNQLFLAGVFLNGTTPPATAPGRLGFTNFDFTSLSPELGQTFFIGDGLTSTSTVQKFFLPTGATSLYLGFVDGGNFVGDPTFYGDNSGSLTIRSVNVVAAAGTTTPEPVSMALFGTGLFGVIGAGRRRRSAARES